MKSRTTQNFIFTIQDSDYPPFLFFISSTGMPAEIEDKWRSGSGMFKVSICVPMDFQPAVFMQTWFAWKERDIETDYAVLN